MANSLRFLSTKVRMPLRRLIIGYAEETGYTLDETTLDRAEEFGMEATRTGLINSPREFAVCTSALILAAIEEGQDTGVTIIGSEQLDNGWARRLRSCLDLPPHQCMRRSIVDREEQLKVKLTGFAQLVTDIDKMDFGGGK